LTCHKYWSKHYQALPDRARRYRLTILKQPDLEKETVVCSICEEPLGTKDKVTGSFCIHKWNLAIQIGKSKTWQTFSVQKIIAAQLLAMVQDEAIHKFLAYTGNIDEVGEALLVSLPIPDLKLDIEPLFTRA